MEGMLLKKFEAVEFYVEFYSILRYTKAERSGYHAQYQTDL